MLNHTFPTHLLGTTAKSRYIHEGDLIPSLTIVFKKILHLICMQPGKMEGFSVHEHN